MNAALFAANVASIEAVPACAWDALPAGILNREWAIMWARLGYDVLAYEHHGRWYLWFAGERLALGRAESAPAAAAERTPATAETAAAAEGQERDDAC